MLRFVVLILLLANGLYYFWSQGWLEAYGFAPVQQSEPQRLAQQIRPQGLRQLSEQELASAQAVSRAPPKPTVCLQAGLFDEAQSATLRRTLEMGLPANAWSLDPATEPARWIVYLGKYSSAETLVKKRAELAALKLKAEPLNNPALELGLSLGGFETQAQANAELGALTKRGLRSARVVQERPEVTGMMLRLPAADEALRSQMQEFKPALAGRSLEPC